MIDLMHEVVVTPRYAFPRVPEVRVIERPGWLQIVTPSIKTGRLNEVIYSALADEDIDRIIDETIAGYRDQGLRFRWNGTPGSAPAGLGAHLVRRGFDESWGRGMALVQPLVGETAPAACEIEVVTAATLAEFTHVMATGWNIDPVSLAALHRQAFGEPHHHHFVAYCAGVPAAAASYIAFDASAFLMGAVVLPAFRGRGIYRALVAARLAHARSFGIELATTHAREVSSAPILEKLGFATVCRFAMYYG